MHARARRVIEWPALLAAISLAAAVLLRPGVANAATLTVTTTDDESVTDCTLRDAITAANINMAWGQCIAGSGDDIINITATGTINLANPLPPLTTNITINGPGAALLDVHRQTGGDYRVFGVGSVVASISDLSVSGGSLTTIGLAGAGIGNSGTLTLDRVRVTGNSVVNISDSLNPAPGGGGIANLGGTMTLRRSTVIGNTVTSSQTGSGPTSVDATGGGIYNTGTLTIERSTISGNSVSATVTSNDASASAFAAGGAIRNYSTIVLKLSTVSGNQATATATSPAVVTTRGSIYNTGTLTMTSATIAFNTATFSANLSAQGTETVTNTIISDPQGGHLERSRGDLPVQAGQGAVEAMCVTDDLQGGRRASRVQDAGHRSGPERRPDAGFAPVQGRADGLMRISMVRKGRRGPLSRRPLSAALMRSLRG